MAKKNISVPPAEKKYILELDQKQLAAFGRMLDATIRATGMQHAQIAVDLQQQVAKQLPKPGATNEIAA
jgi:hypothetical protein